MLEQEGELAALADAVEVAVDLVVLTACRANKNSCKLQMAAWPAERRPRAAPALAISQEQSCATILFSFF